MIKKLLKTLSVILITAPGTVSAQAADNDGLAAGPYERLVIRNAMVLPGHGGPPVGPYDIVIENDEITEMIKFDPVTAKRRGEVERVSGDRVIDATDKFVMPGMIDLHMHLRQDPMPLEYVYYLKLAHGVTTMVPAPDRGLDEAMEQAALAERNEIIAPRMFPIWEWGSNLDYDHKYLEDPENADKIAREMVRKGGHVFNAASVGWDNELLTAMCQAITKAGGITTYHIPPSDTSVTRAVEAAEAGCTMIEHHYAYAESSLDRKVQDYPNDYNYNDESMRFRHAGKVWSEANEERLLTEVVDRLVESGVVMLPTRVVYEANRDILRAHGLPWHEKYTHERLIFWNGPNPEYHGAYHYDWSSDDEYYWSHAFRLWGDLIYEFNKRGGTVAYGTDDNYIWATPGFSNIRELQLIRETGMHTLEVLKSATLNSAKTLRQPKLGLVRPGYTADLMIIDSSPLYNLRFMYSFGAFTRDKDGNMIRKGGIDHTIKGGVVYENKKLMDEVERMVAESKVGKPGSPAKEPFRMDSR